MIVDWSLRQESLVRVFNKWGANGDHVWLFDDAELELRLAALRSCSLLPDEIPVVLSWHGKLEWSLITTHRLLIYIGDELIAAEWKDVDELRPVIRGDKPKVSMDWLHVSLQDGTQEVDLKLDPGPPFFGFWNVAKTAMSMASG